MKEFSSRQEKIDVNTVKTICKKHNILVYFDHDRHTSRPSINSIPLVFYVDTPHGMAFTRQFITSEAIRHTTYINDILPKEILKEIDELIKRTEKKEQNDSPFTESQYIELRKVGLSDKDIVTVYNKVKHYSLRMNVDMDKAVKDFADVIFHFPEIELKKLVDAYHRAYSVALPWWRVLFCTEESAERWYKRRLDGYLARWTVKSTDKGEKKLEVVK